MFLFVLSSCENRYKMITYKISKEFGVLHSETEIKAKNDSIAYSEALIRFYLGRNAEDEMYKDGPENAYRSHKFKLYNSDDETVSPPIYSRRDMKVLNAILRTDTEDLYMQIEKNLYKNSWEKY